MVLGQIPVDTITDDKLSGTAGHIKDRVLKLVDQVLSIFKIPQSRIDFNHLLSYEAESGYGDVGIKQGWLQGFCIVGNNIVLARISSYQQTNDVILSEISMDTMKLVREVTLPLGHANDLEYIPETNEIICCPYQMLEDGSWVTVQYLIAIDYTTLTIKRNININSGASGIAYDKVTHEFAFRADYNITYLDSNFQPIKTVTCENPNDNSISQGMTLDNGYIYMNRSTPETLHVWSADGTLQKSYTIPRYTNEGEYIFESECIKALGNGKFILGTTQAKDSSLKTSVFNFYSIDIFGRNKSTTKYSYGLSRYNERTIKLFVDPAYPKLDSDGTQTKPFKDLQSAINMCNGNYHYMITLVAGTYSYTDVNNVTSKISIVGGTAATKGQFIINGIKGYNCNYIQATGVTINQAADGKSIMLIDCTMRLIDSDSSTVSISNSKLLLSGTTNIHDAAYGIYLNNGSQCIVADSTVTFTNCTTADIYADIASVCRVNPAVVLSKIKISNGGDIYYKYPEIRHAFNYYLSKGIAVKHNTFGSIEPTAAVSLNALIHTGQYYLSSTLVTELPTAANYYCVVTAADSGHCTQKLTSTSTVNFDEYIRKGTMSGGVMTWGNFAKTTSV